MKHLWYFLKMLLHLLFFRLIYDSCHDIWKYTELVKVTHFHSDIERLCYLILVKFKNESYPFHTITKELRQVIVEVLIHDIQVMFEIICQEIQFEEDFLKIFLYQGQYSDEFYVTQSWNYIIRDRMVLITYQQWKFNV